MKAIFTLLLATVFTTAFAYDEGRLTITVATARNVDIMVNGRLYESADRSLVLNNIQPGSHTIRVYREDRRNVRSGNSRARNNRRSESDLLYTSTVYVRPDHHVDVMINRFGKALVDERALNSRNRDWEDDDWNDRFDRNNRAAISDVEFNRLLQRISGQWFGRLGNARDAINSNFFTVAQVRQVLTLFSAESEKLELAKLSYTKVVDRASFRQLYDLFSYNGQRELERLAGEERW